MPAKMAPPSLTLDISSGSTSRRHFLGAAPTDGTLPFLIDWGRTPHPSESLHHPLALHRLRIRHPDPDPLRSFLRALAPRVVVVAGERPGLSATLETPHGRVELA